jgi:hypothetical protein
MPSQIAKFSVEANDTSISYGNGSLVFHLSGVQAPPGLQVLQCWPLAWHTINGTLGPSRMRCIGGMCERCNLSGCIGNPPPPGVPPTTTNAYWMGVPPGLDIATNTLIPPTGFASFGTVYVSDDVPASFDALASALAIWLGAQTEELFFHVYKLQVPGGTGLLHNRVIAIPVEMP